MGVLYSFLNGGFLLEASVTIRSEGVQRGRRRWDAERADHGEGDAWIWNREDL